jgi:hypothetical protein
LLRGRLARTPVSPRAILTWRNSTAVGYS